MDPFQEVLRDAQQQLSSVNKQLGDYELDPAHDKLVDIGNLMQELTETVHDLSQSIAAAQQDPAAFGVDVTEINRRIQQVGQINSQVSDVQQQLADIRQSVKPTSQPPPVDEGFETVDMDQGARDMMLQQQVAEQDTILDSVYETVTQLREQANVMGRELEDQAIMLDDFEQQADSTGDRLRQGLRRVDYVLRHNSETLSSCCITLLIIALVILLVLVIVI